MKTARNMLVFLIVACLILTSCSQPDMQKASDNDISAASPAAQVSEKPMDSPAASSSAPAQPLQTAPELPQELNDIDNASLAALPLDLPALTEEDKKVFNPDKVLSYIISDMEFGEREYCFTLDKTELKDGRLYLESTLNIGLPDINAAYQDLAKYKLADEQILQIPMFAGCFIDGGKMYNSKDAWEDSKTFKSYEEWADQNEGFINSFDLGEIKVSSLPVAQDAKITLFDSEKGNYDVTMEQFIKRLLNGKQSETDFVEDEGMNTMDCLYFTYAGGQITSVTQTSGDI